MIYVSIDIETSGLDPEKNKILSIGAIIEDTGKKLSFDKIPKFNVVVLQREILGSPKALTINSDLIECMSHYLESDSNFKKEIEVTTGFEFIEEDEVVKKFYSFLNTHLNNQNQELGDDKLIKMLTINVAGKNFATFDKLFLERLPWWKKIIRTRQRVIDPSILFCDWSNDTTLPSLDDCKKRGDISGVVTHNALEDAWDVIQLLRKFY